MTSPRKPSRFNFMYNKIDSNVVSRCNDFKNLGVIVDPKLLVILHIAIINVQTGIENQI